MPFREFLLGATLIALPFGASAQAVNGLYVGAGLGIDLHSDESVKNLSIGNGPLGGLSTSGNSKFDLGWGGLTNLGYGFGNGFRVEGQFNYFTNKNDGFTGGSVPMHGSGTEDRWGVMANVLYDFVGLVPYVQPYVGAGIGVQWVNWHDFRGSNVNAIAFNGTTVPPGGLAASSSGDAKAVFAYQAIAGLSVPFYSVPGLALTAEYRFLGTAGNRSTSATYTGISTSGRALAANGKVQLGPTFDNIFLVGFRYNFRTF
jgi:OOP family OmpA-OmpF porin